MRTTNIKKKSIKLIIFEYLNMLSKLFDKFKKASVGVKTVVVFLIMLSIWMLTFLFKGNENINDSHKSVKSVNYKIIESVAVNKPKVLHFTGITEAKEQVNLVSELEGNVVNILAKEGDLLKKGDPIIEIESKNYIQKYEAAKEHVASMEIAYQSALKLKKKGLGSDASLASAKSQLYDAKAKLKQAKMNLDDRMIKAPYDGIVDEISVKINTHLAPFTQVGRFLSKDTIKVKFDVPSSQFNDVKNSVSASLFLDGKKITTNKVSSLSDIANNITKTYNAEVLTENVDFILRSGQVIDVQVNVGDFLAHKVSQSTLNINADGHLGVKILNEDNIVEFIEVEIIGEDSDGFWIINLPESVKIITMGHSYVKQGDKLESISKNGKDS